MIWANFLSYVSYIFCKKIWPTIKHECDIFIWKLGNENQMVQLWTNEIHWGLYSTVFDINNVSVTCTYILNAVCYPEAISATYINAVCKRLFVNSWWKNATTGPIYLCNLPWLLICLIQYLPC